MQLISTECEQTRHTQFVFCFLLLLLLLLLLRNRNRKRKRLKIISVTDARQTQLNGTGFRNMKWWWEKRSDTLNAAEQECAHFWLCDHHCIEKFGIHWTTFGNTFQTWISFACIHTFYPLHRNSGCAQNLCNTISVQSFSNFVRDTRAQRTIGCVGLALVR